MLRVFVLLACLVGAGAAALDAWADEPEGWLQGVVVDEDGAPVPGAWVVVHGPNAHGFHGRESHASLARYFEAPPEQRARLRTDAAGRFVVSALEVDGHYHMRVEHAESQAVGYAFAHARRGGAPDARIVLGPARELRLRVTGPDGKPAAASISVVNTHVADHWGSQARSAQALVIAQPTDAEGRLLLRTAAHGVTYISAFVPGVGRRSVQVGEGSGAREVAIAVGKAGACEAHGRVLDEGGKPLAGARVVLRHRVERPPPYMPEDVRVARTEADGRWRIAGMPEGYISGVFVSSPGKVALSTAQVQVPTAPTRPWVTDFTLGPGMPVQGRVVDEAGKPVPGATVSVNQWLPGRANNVSLTVTGDAEGRFDCGRLWQRSIQIRAVAPGFVDGAWQTLAAARGDERLEPKLTLERGRSWAVRVVHADGTPAPRVHGSLTLSVRVQPSASRPQGWHVGLSRSAVSDEDGWLRFHGLANRGTATLNVRSATRGWLQQPLVWPPPAGEKHPAVILREAFVVRGEVVDADGKPLARANVWSPMGGHNQTDARGRFELAMTSAGRHRVLVGVQQRPLASALAEVSSEAPEAFVRLVAKRGLPLRGRVHDADGKPVVGVNVGIWPAHAAGLNMQLRTDAEGRFAARQVPEGSYTLRVGAHNAKAHSVKAGAVDLVFEHTPKRRGRIYEGRLLDSEGTPVAYGGVQIARGDDGPNFMRGHGYVFGGVFRFLWTEDLEASKPTIKPLYVVDGSGRAIDAQRERRPLAVANHEAKELRLTRGRAVEGIVVDHEGRPVGGLQLTLQPQPVPNAPRHFHGPHPTTMSGQDGRWRFGGVGSGAKQLYLSSAEFMPVTTIPLVLTGDEKEIRVVVRPWGRVSGRVLDPDGQPVPMAQVRLTWRTEGQRHPQMLHSRSNNDGRFVFERVQPLLPMSIRVDPPPARDGVMFVPMVSGGVRPDDADLEVRLHRALSIGGRVLDPEGNGIEGIRVTAQNIRPAIEGTVLHSTGQRSAVTDEEGRYELMGFELGALCKLHFQPSRENRNDFFADDRDKIPAGAMDVTVRLARAQTIRAEVVGVDAKELAGLQLTLSPVVKDAQRNRPRRFRFDGSSARVEFSQLRPGMYVLTWSRNSRARVILPEKTQVKAGTQDLRIEVVPIRRIEGRVIADQPTRYRVAFFDAAGRRHEGSVKSDGTFSFGSVDDKPGFLFVHGNGDALGYLETDVRATDGPFALKLVKGKPIRGRIVGLPDKIRRGRVYATFGALRVPGRLAEDGWFDLPLLPDGRWGLAFEMRSPKGRIEAPKSVKAGDESVVAEYRN